MANYVTHPYTVRHTKSPSQILVEVLGMMHMAIYDSNGGKYIASGTNELECLKDYLSHIDAVYIECDEEGNEIE